MIEDVCIDIRRITSICDTPLIVDADTGWGHAFNVIELLKSLSESAAGLHIERSSCCKRCGHRPNKELVSLKRCVIESELLLMQKELDPDFYILQELMHMHLKGQAAAIRARAKAYVEAGADAILHEAVHTLKEYKEFTDAMTVPVLANITEFEQPLFTTEELASVGIAMVLYPLSAFRAMNKAALNVYQEFKKDKELNNS